MVRHTPVTMLGMVIAFSLTALVAIVPMAALVVMQHDLPQTSPMSSTAHGPLVLAVVGGVLMSLAAVLVTWGTRRRLRSERA